MKVKMAMALTVVLMVFSTFSYGRDLPVFTDLIEKQSPAVVKITTETSVRATRSPFGSEQEIPPFFREFFGPGGAPEERAPENQRGLGSGFFISKDGYVLTNRHVVEGADTVTVQLQDRREYDAEVIGTDQGSDLALLKIEAKGLPYLTFGKPDDVRVGEWVVAIGSPFGFDYTASVGIVSAIGRSIGGGRERYTQFIQTDVAINPGNSGGPLFNLDGEVVGINSQIYTRSGGYMGVSFAIPVAVAEPVIEQLKTTGTVERGWLGIEFGNVTKDLAEAVGLKKTTGASVLSVVKDSPADKAGIEPGDVILTFNDVEIITSGDLAPVVGRIRPGKKIDVELIRRRKRKTFVVEIGSLSGSNARASISRPEPSNQQNLENRLGLSVIQVDERLKERLDIAGGVVVQNVNPTGPAAKTGIRPNDVIVSIDFKAVDNLQSFREIVEGLPEGAKLPIRFYQNERPQFRSIEIEE